MTAAPLSPADVSVVIVTWNGRALLDRCLPSVVAHADGAEVLVVDNGSEDGTAAHLAAAFPSVRVLALGENRGFCGGNNAGAEAARGRVLLFLNNDVEVTPGWLGPLARHFDAHPACAAAQPKLLSYDRRTTFEYAGGAGGYLDRDGYPFTRGRLFDALEDDAGQYDDARRVFWATGAALAVRRDALGGHAPFDDRYFMHMEEIDLCWRLWSAGHEVWCVPASVVYHIGGASLAAGHPRKVYHNFRNNLLLLSRHLSPGAFRRTLARRAVLDTAAALRALAAGRPAEAIAIARAYADAHRMRADFAPGTAALPRTARPAAPDAAPDAAPWPPYRRSIVSDHFLRRRTRFSDLDADAFHPRLR